MTFYINTINTIIIISSSRSSIVINIARYKVPQPWTCGVLRPPPPPSNHPGPSTMYITYYVYMYIYIYIYIYLCIHLSLYIYIYVYTYVYIYIYSVYIYIYMYIYIYIHVLCNYHYTYTYTYIYIYIHTCYICPPRGSLGRPSAAPPGPCRACRRSRPNDDDIANMHQIDNS